MRAQSRLGGAPAARHFVLFVLWVLLAAPSPAPLGAAGGPDYQRQVRPILSENCFACHGPDRRQRKGGLRLDEREGALAKLRSGRFAIVPGDPERSLLLELVAAEDEDERMPPARTGKRLAPAEIELLRAWIAAGAEFEEHWAYVPPRRPPVPPVALEGWARNEVDRFILARLEKEGLAPSPEAGRETLIRRLSLDLRGLPPALEEVDAFLADRAAGAYERLADRFLDSPQFGEHMAQWWLDLARYADSDGYHVDHSRSMWQYRDWVIRAFNANMPFDRFTIEQLAGDLLPGATLEQRIATAFLRSGMLTTEAGADAEEYLTKYAIDRVNTTGAVWLGSTIACAECHDHKYDPFTQKEFYQLYDFFSRVPEKGLDLDPAPPFVKVPAEEETARLEELEREIALLEARRAELAEAADPALEAEEAAWERRLVEELPRLEEIEAGDWHLLAPCGAEPGATACAALPPEAAAPAGAGVACLPRPELADGAAHTLEGGGAKTRLHRSLRARAAGTLKLSLESGAGITASWNGRRVLARAPGAAKRRGEIEVVVRPGENRLFLELDHEGGERGFQFSRGAFAIDPGLAKAREILRRPPAERTQAERAELRRALRENQVPIFAEAAARLAEARKERDAVEAGIATIRVMEDMPDPPPTHILLRGDYRRKGERVEADVPAFLPPLPSMAPRGAAASSAAERPDRLALARWLTDPGHPLVARVTANRIWELLFGAGLVRTGEDFGSQGERPTHPELLDWLACELAGGGWDLKGLIRRLVCSSTYRQSSAVRAELLARDPENRLLARAPRLRLPAEAIRDNALAVSGLLDRGRAPGGPSVYPYQPEGLWVETLAAGMTDYPESRGADRWRRSLYSFWKRSGLNPVLRTFDAPTREVCTVRRESTSTPLQALHLLNEKSYLEAAAALARRILDEGGEEDLERIRFAFRAALARLPGERELAAIAAAHRDVLDSYRLDPAAALELAGVGAVPPAEDDPATFAAWMCVASLILNLDETITRE
jgi:mono/diheme cytochrome c family protein